ncbi:MAG: GTP-binding protein [bacterium]
MTKQLPILLVTGFLGSGKTTFINYLIKNNSDKLISLILNEFGDVKLESQFIEKEGVGLITELANGCMCCVAKSDIPRVVRYILSEAPHTEHIIIEASGLSDPDPVREVLSQGELTSLIRLDTIVCIVDAVNFDSLSQAHPLVLSQIADADLIVVSKAQQVEKTTLTHLVETVSHIGLGTQTLVWDDSLDPQIFFDPHLTSPSPRIHNEVCSHSHAHMDEYWYTSSKSLNPDTLYQLLESLPSSIIRLKGYTDVGGARYLIQRVGTHIDIRSAEKDQTSPHVTAILCLGTKLDQKSLAHQFAQALIDHHDV